MASNRRIPVRTSCRRMGCVRRALKLHLNRRVKPNVEVERVLGRSHRRIPAAGLPALAELQGSTRVMKLECTSWSLIGAESQGANHEVQTGHGKRAESAFSNQTRIRYTSALD